MARELDFETLPRLLGEECDGPHGNRTEVYRLDIPERSDSLWLCQRCYCSRWAAAGRPAQRQMRGAS